MTFSITAMGCKVSAYDAEALAGILTEKGMTRALSDQKADVFVINTCTVTGTGDKKSRQAIRRAKRLNPDAIVVASGCYARISPEEAGAIEGVSIVCGLKGAKYLADAVMDYRPEMGVLFLGFEDGDFPWVSVKDFDNRTRAFIKIQDGCDNFCAYCIVPYARGRARSRPLGDVLTEARYAAEKGFREVVLTGIHAASYGKDLQGGSLIDLIEAVHDIRGIDRIRLSSLEVSAITEDFVDRAAKLNKLCPHFHLSLQSGCDKTIAAMNRKYTAKQYELAVALLRSAVNGVAITTDMIVGFPGETEEDFNESYAFAERLKFSKIHVFPYSKRSGTKAAAMPGQIPKAVKEQRAAKLAALSDRLGESFRSSFRGKTLKTLIEESCGDGIYEGYTGNYLRVKVKSPVSIVNEIVDAIIE